MKNYSSKQITRIRKSLGKACSAYTKALSEKTKLSPPTVSKFLNNKGVSPENEIKIMEAALELIQEKANCNKAIKDRLSQL